MDVSTQCIQDKNDKAMTKVSNENNKNTAGWAGSVFWANFKDMVNKIAHTHFSDSNQILIHISFTKWFTDDAHHSLSGTWVLVPQLAALSEMAQAVWSVGGRLSFGSRF